MGQVNRFIPLNPIEPSPMSFRAIRGVEQVLKLFYLDATGTIYRQDVTGQLEVTSIGDGTSVNYAVPATDIVNGEAMAVIPADDLGDMHGYRMRLFGSVDGLPTLIATGTIRMTDTGGLQPVPVDVVDSIDLTFVIHQAVTLYIDCWQDTGKQIPYDLTVVTVGANIYLDQNASNVLMPFTQVSVDANTVQLTLTSAQVDSLPAQCWWNLRITQAGIVSTLAEGNVIVAPAPVIVGGLT